MVITDVSTASDRSPARLQAWRSCRCCAAQIHRWDQRHAGRMCPLRLQKIPASRLCLSGAAWSCLKHSWLPRAGWMWPELSRLQRPSRCAVAASCKAPSRTWHPMFCQTWYASPLSRGVSHWPRHHCIAMAHMGMKQLVGINHNNHP